MRHTRIGSPVRTLPDRWQVIYRHARVLLPLVPAVRIADRLWRDELRELRTFGFEESWDSAAVKEARSYVCEFCGNDKDLRVSPTASSASTPRPYCTLARFDEASHDGNRGSHLAVVQRAREG